MTKKHRYLNNSLKLICRIAIFLGLFLLITYKSFAQSKCDEIEYFPLTPKPSLANMLSGVKYASIRMPEIVGHLPVFNSLSEYLKAMGFEVKYLNQNYEPSKNLCEEIWVEIIFDYDFENFRNIKLLFVSPCSGYKWELTTQKSIKAGLYSDPKTSFYNLLREMYPYQKASFDSFHSIKLQKYKTCWKEISIKNFMKSNGCDKIEGIYESTSNSPKYKVAVKKLKDLYYIIYLSGANDTYQWDQGEIKATLEPTATPSIYKAKWIMLNKSEKNDYYVTFEQGMFSTISSENEKDLYIKLFPTETDNFEKPKSETSSSGTGYAISSNGLIATNYHVANKTSTSIKIKGINGNFLKKYSAKVLVEDKNNDLSILQIDDPNFNSLGIIPYIISSQNSDVGSSIFVLGYPLRATMGDEVKLTNGIISSKSGFQGDITAYQITAPVQPGNSGGPLFDSKGNIIGIINAKHLGAENASYAIKSSYLLSLINSLPSPPKLQTINSVSGKSLSEQVKSLMKFTYIIDVN